MLNRSKRVHPPSIYLLFAFPTSLMASQENLKVIVCFPYFFDGFARESQNYLGCNVQYPDTTSKKGACMLALAIPSFYIYMIIISITFGNLLFISGIDYASVHAE